MTINLLKPLPDGLINMKNIYPEYTKTVFVDTLVVFMDVESNIIESRKREKEDGLKNEISSEAAKIKIIIK